LWQSLPEVHRQCAISYTDFWEAYEQVLSSKQHQAVGKETGQTGYIVRVSVAKQNGLTTPCANGSDVWFAKSYRSLRN